MEFLTDEDIKESEKFACKEVGLMYMTVKACKRYVESGESLDILLEEIEKCVKKEDLKK